MNYDTMEAGREMDALVAEKVMGIVWDETRCRICGWPLREKVEDGCVEGNCSMRPFPPRRADGSAAYSTSISAAWEVVEKMGTTNNGKCFELRKYRLEDGTTMYSALGKRYAEAPTAPLAICRAALKAVSK